MPLVSVIMPCYNVAITLPQALASVRNQTLSDIEIICINDGSADDTLAILQATADADSRIRIIDQPNAGYGASCNKGIEASTGEYVAIVEPDDWIELDMYERMIAYANSIKAQAAKQSKSILIDVIKTPYWREVPSDTQAPNEGDEKQDYVYPTKKLNCSYRGRISPHTKLFRVWDTPHLLKHHPSIWSALYRRQFLQKANIKFAEYPGSGWADNPFLYDSLFPAWIIYLNKSFYHYREESRAEFRDFMFNQTALPLERWCAMDDILKKYLKKNPEVGEDYRAVINLSTAHYHRAFRYLQDTLQAEEDFDDEIAGLINQVLLRMNPQVVRKTGSISPKLRRIYNELTGAQGGNPSKLRYAGFLLGQGVYNLRNIGPAATLKLIRSQ